MPWRAFREAGTANILAIDGGQPARNEDRMVTHADNKASGTHSVAMTAHRDPGPPAIPPAPEPAGTETAT